MFLVFLSLKLCLHDYAVQTVRCSIILQGEVYIAYEFVAQTYPANSQSLTLLNKFMEQCRLHFLKQNYSAEWYLSGQIPIKTQLFFEEKSTNPLPEQGTL